MTLDVLQIPNSITNEVPFTLAQMTVKPVIHNTIANWRHKPLERPERQLFHIISKKRIRDMLFLSFSILRRTEVIRKARSRCS